MKVDQDTGLRFFEPGDDIVDIDLLHAVTCTKEVTDDENFERLDIFKQELPIERFINDNDLVLEPIRAEFDLRVGLNSVTKNDERYVHSNDIVSDTFKIRSVQRAVQKLPSHAYERLTRCQTCRKPCTLIKYIYGFIVFMHAVRGNSTETSSMPDDHVASHEDEKNEEVEPLDLNEEIKEIEHGLVPSDRLPLSNADEGKDIGDIALVAYPTFVFPDNRSFVLLIDIMKNFNLREDYCWAAMANFCEAEKDFIDESVDTAYSEEDTLHTAETALQRVFHDALTNETKIPNEDEFMRLQSSMGVSTMGTSWNPVVEQEETRIDLYKPWLLEEDENQQVFVYDDPFLLRRGGTRNSSNPLMKKDAGMINYLSNIDCSKIIVFHTKYSPQQAEFPLMALKAVTTFAGGEQIHHNAEKVVLVEKQFALRVFGQGPYFPTIERAPYMLNYTAHALSLGIRDPGLLKNGGCRELIRGAKSRVALPLPPPPVVAEVADAAHENHEVEAGRPEKRLKTTSDQS